MRLFQLRRRHLILGLLVPAIALNVWVLERAFRYFEQLFTLIITAAILAFLLNYLVKILERWGLRRPLAIAIVVLVTLATIGVLGFILVPLVVEQATQFLGVVTVWLRDGNQSFDWLDRLADERRLPLDLDKIREQINARAELLIGQLPGFAISTVGRLFDTVLISVLAFYMLFYGGRLWQGLINLLPSPLNSVLNQSLQLSLRRFFVAQLFLALFMFVALIPVLMALNVNFGVLFAFVIGASQLIPVIGATLGIGLVTLLVLTQSFWLGLWVGISAFTLQQIKDNIFAPRLLGNMIGLNPLWQFIAVLIGIRVAGLLGVLLSIPIAATIKVTVEELRSLPLAFMESGEQQMSEGDSGKAEGRR
jgi:predicted PurR-regulated permease PerM